MNFDIEDLIEKSMDIGGVDKKKVIKIMVEGVKSKCAEEDTYEKLYREIYGNVLQPAECEELIASLYQGEEKGAKWSLDDAKTVANKLDFDFDKKPYTPEEFRAAMHIKYYDNAVPLKRSGVTLENTGWGRLGDFYFTGDDEKEGKIVDYFFDRMK